METPSTFNPPPASPRKSKTGLIIGIIVGAVAICCGGPVLGILFAYKWGVKTLGSTLQCGIGFTEVRIAIADYAKDHQNTLPKAATWEDDIRPYFAKISGRDANPTPFQGFDPQSPWGCADDKGQMRTGIAYNSDLSGKKISDIDDPEDTPLIFEVASTGNNLTQKFKRLPEGMGPTFMGKPREGIVIYLLGDKGNPFGVQQRSSSSDAFPSDPFGYDKSKDSNSSSGSSSP